MVVLALMMVGIQSCSDELHDVGDVQVSFTATQIGRASCRERV